MSHPQTYSGKAISDAIYKALNRCPPSWAFPECVLRCTGNIGDFFERKLNLDLRVNSELISKLLDSECYISKRLTNELGWQPMVDLETGLSEMLEHEKNL